MSWYFWLRVSEIVLTMSLACSEINSSVPASTMRLPTSATPMINRTVQVYFSPASINGLARLSNATVHFNFSLEDTDDSFQYLDVNGTYIARVTSQNGKLLQLVIPPHLVIRDREHRYSRGPFLTNDLRFPIHLNGVSNFTIQAMQIGYVTVLVTIFGTSSMAMANSQKSQTITSASYKVTVTPRQKTADFVFDCSAAAVAILISFGMGCVTDTENLKRQLKYPVSLVLGFCCQFLLMPVSVYMTFTDPRKVMFTSAEVGEHHFSQLAFGLAMILPLEKNVRFGMLCVACVPGGGIGHVAVIISDSNLPLSLTMNLISTVTMLGTAPLWIFVLGQYFQRTEGSKIIPIYNFEIWLASTFFAYTAGLVINRFKPDVADGLLMWLIKPFMLLAAILYVTLGVYINMYVFEVIEGVTITAAILLPLCGILVGSVLSIIFRQKTDFMKTMALETSSLNCLIVVAALRFSLNQPDANLASVIPIWAMFTIPGMYVVLAILRMMKKSIDEYMESRKQKQYRQYSIASGIVNQANMAALSAPLFVTDTATEDDQASVSEKITVL